MTSARPSPRPRTDGPSPHVFRVVAGDRGELFDRLDDAEEYVRRLGGGSVERVPLRRSLDAAREVYERRVVLRDDEVVRDEVATHLMFDAEFDAVDTEWFRGEHGEWHVLAYGLDRDRVTTEVDTRVAVLRQGIEPRSAETLHEMRK